MSGTCRCEKQILIVEAEIGKRRYRFHGDALDLDLGTEPPDSVEPLRTHIEGCSAFPGL
jgi:hypothetical protein